MLHHSFSSHMSLLLITVAVWYLSITSCCVIFFRSRLEAHVGMVDYIACLAFSSLTVIARLYHGPHLSYSHVYRIVRTLNRQHKQSQRCSRNKQNDGRRRESRATVSQLPTNSSGRGILSNHIRLPYTAKGAEIHLSHLISYSPFSSRISEHWTTPANRYLSIY